MIFPPISSPVVSKSFVALELWGQDDDDDKNGEQRSFILDSFNIQLLTRAECKEFGIKKKAPAGPRHGRIAKVAWRASSSRLDVSAFEPLTSTCPRAWRLKG